MTEGKNNGLLSQPELLLKWLLRMIGATLMLATLAIFLPVSWMQSTHEFLGIDGEFHDLPIVKYLARSTSMLYALHGSVLMFLSFDVKRLASLCRWIGWLHVLMGIAILIVDIEAGMPLYWIVVEGAPISFGGGLMIWLSNRVCLRGSNEAENFSGSGSG